MLALKETGPTGLHSRMNQLAMGLLWLTLICSFQNVLIGAQFATLKLSFPALVGYLAISCLVQLSYAFPVCYLATRTGLGFLEMVRRVFGARGGVLLAFFLIGINTFWYALTAILLTENLVKYWHIDGRLIRWFCLLCTCLMAVNNFLGFRGVARFAQYIGAPVILIWVLYAFGKILHTQPVSAPVHAPLSGPSFGVALGVISSLTIGAVSWGNEADFWRFGRPRASSVALSLSLSLAISLIVFPCAGWLLATRLPNVDPEQMLGPLIEHTLGGSPTIAILAFAISWFSMVDGVLYANTEAMLGLTTLSRRKIVVILLLCAAGLGQLLLDFSNKIAIGVGLSAIFLPAAAIIVWQELALFNPSLLDSRQPDAAVPNGLEQGSGTIIWQSMVALLVGSVVGLISFGFLPGPSVLREGIPPLYGWVAAAVSFAALRLLARKPRAELQRGEVLMNQPDAASPRG